MDRIRARIGNKRVAILLHGKSVSGILKYSNVFTEQRFVLISTNAFSIIENKVLAPLGLGLNIVAIFYEAEWGLRMQDTIEFLSRDNQNLIITTRRQQSIDDCNDRLAPYTNQVIFVDDATPVEIEMPNSVTLLIQRLIGAGCRDITLFGADGCSTNTPLEAQYGTYIGGEQLKHELRATAIRADTVLMNNDFHRYIKQARKLYNVSGPISIVNCSPSSHFTCFENIMYSELQSRVS